MEQQPRKTFEPHQKSVISTLDEMVFHPNFWPEVPAEFSKRNYIGGILRSGGAVKLKVAGFTEFYIKSTDSDNTKNGNFILAGIRAMNRQGTEMGGAYLIDPDAVEAGKFDLLRNSDRHKIRSFDVQYPKDDAEKEKLKISQTLGKDIESLDFLDIPVQNLLKKEIKSLEFLDREVF